MEEHFKEADVNSDGQLSLDEVQAKMPRLAERFNTLDADKNGLLSKEELQHGGPRQRLRPPELIAYPSSKQKAAGPRRPRRFLLPACDYCGFALTEASPLAFAFAFALRIRPAS